MLLGAGAGPRARRRCLEVARWRSRCSGAFGGVLSLFDAVLVIIRGEICVGSSVWKGEGGLGVWRRV